MASSFIPEIDKTTYKGLMTGLFLTKNLHNSEKIEYYRTIDAIRNVMNHCA